MLNIHLAVRHTRRVRLAEMFRLRPGEEFFLAFPDGIRGKEHIAFFLAVKAEELEFEEPVHILGADTGILPNLNIGIGEFRLDFEAVHCYVHDRTSCGRGEGAGCPLKLAISYRSFAAEQRGCNNENHFQQSEIAIQ